jgi:hypothetical protein
MRSYVENSCKRCYSTSEYPTLYQDLIGYLDVAVQALGPGSSEPAALLIAASRYCSKQDARCETVLEAIRSHTIDHPNSSKQQQQHALGGTSSTTGAESGERGDTAIKEAVEDCLDAAGWVWRITGQQELLRAAIYGRSNAPAVVDAALVSHTALHCRVFHSFASPAGCDSSHALCCVCMGSLSHYFHELGAFE